MHHGKLADLSVFEVDDMTLNQVRATTGAIVDGTTRVARQ